MKYLGYIGLFVALSVLVGCQSMPDFSKGGFGYKDPDKNVDVSCRTIDGISKCSYVGADGKEVFIEGEITVPGEPPVDQDPK